MKEEMRRKRCQTVEQGEEEELGEEGGEVEKGGDQKVEEREEGVDEERVEERGKSMW